MIPCNLVGLVLTLITAGLSPQRSFLMAFVEVVASGILRIVALCFHWICYDRIEKWHNQRKGSSQSS
ncbi:putative 3-dehydrosphinganine reductase [Lupinus albus]|uniref:Putative 3-dehydrosphinganine reductase n=1 Tax=Lupinus albus TaxID=3870 RepID=A0A6A4NPM6_LUPAL|nr:putative 3-dehydrosphinganine reductase [Lupinus albus]